ncbi:MAG: ribonuclease HII [Oscillospiraceae bacterium]|nr:ribonuclease HII [Oscillospiraceae bacterium]
MNNLYEYDSAVRTNYPVLCGADEAGRGPLCGPVCCAAVVLKPDFICDEINDSKKISEKKREKLYNIIIENALAYSVIMVSPQEIDRINILNASLEGMKNAVKSVGFTPDIVLIDGNKTPRDMPCKTESVVKGDATSMSIAAASILAKVSRDRYMRQLDKEYPQYQLSKHKGYPTKLHYELIAEHGIQDFYRRSFFTKRPELLWTKD